MGTEEGEGRSESVILRRRDYSRSRCQDNSGGGRSVDVADNGRIVDVVYVVAKKEL